MSCCNTNDSEYLQARITRTEELIAKYEDAIDAIATGAQFYQLDTGQTRQMVSKAQLGQLREALSSLENRRETLRARLCGSSTRVIPGF